MESVIHLSNNRNQIKNSLPFEGKGTLFWWGPPFQPLQVVALPPTPRAKTRVIYVLIPHLLSIKTCQKDVVRLNTLKTDIGDRRQEPSCTSTGGPNSRYEGRVQCNLHTLGDAPVSRYRRPLSEYKRLCMRNILLRSANAR